jgi:hypothetical protein
VRLMANLPASISGETPSMTTRRRPSGWDMRAPLRRSGGHYYLTREGKPFDVPRIAYVRACAPLGERPHEQRGGDLALTFE